MPAPIVPLQDIRRSLPTKLKQLVESPFCGSYTLTDKPIYATEGIVANAREHLHHAALFQGTIIAESASWKMPSQRFEALSWWIRLGELGCVNVKF